MKAWLTTGVALTAALGLGAAPAWACDDYRLIVKQTYEQYLHRCPDRDGFEAAVCCLRRGGSVEGFQAGVIGSDEYYRLHGCSPRGFVIGLYEDVLGREPECSEVRSWLCNLDCCGCRATLARQFLCAAQRELALRPAEAPPSFDPPPVPYDPPPRRFAPPPPPSPFGPGYDDGAGRVSITVRIRR
jgi:hypothetical protein